MGKLAEAVDRNDIQEVQNLLVGEYRGSELINKETNEDNYSPLNALQMAVYKGYVGIVEVLVKAGAKVDYPSGATDATPLYSAACQGHIKMMEVLIKAGANFNQATKNGWSPLLIALLKGNLAAVQLLVKAGADVNQATRKGETPLYAAAFLDNVKFAQILLEAGAKLDLANQQGKTSLYIAAEYGHLEAVKLLLKAGADFTLNAKGGLSALAIAKQNNHREMVTLLLQYGAKESPNIHQIKADEYSGKALPDRQETILQRLASLKQQIAALNLSPAIKALIDLHYTIPYSELVFESKIGEGSFGKVYVGSWNKQTVAIKTIEGLLTEEDKEEFIREIQIMSQLRYKQVTQFYGACLESHRFCLVMECMEKGSLYQLLGKVKLTPEQQK